MRRVSHASGSPLHPNCQNCAAPLQGPFCHRCGQHDFDANQSFRHVFIEALEDFFHFDTKLFRTVYTLLFQPGRLSASYNAGKRVAQVPPFRLYIFVSVLFFLVSFYSSQPLHVSARPLKEAAAGPVAAPAKPGKEPASAGVAPTSVWEEKSRRAALHPEELTHQFVVVLPKVFLFCLPIFALLTWLFFRRAAPAYLAHLVIALHFHSFVYLWRMTGNGWVFLFGQASPTLARVVGLAINLWLIAYPVIMLRVLFRESWFATVLKGLGVFVAYILVIVLGFLLTAAALVLTA